MKRIVFTLAVGKPKFARFALGLGRSLKLIGDTTRRVVVTDQLNYPWDRCFDEVIAPEDPIEWIMYSKLTALERTDADQVLFIDGDSLAFKRLDPIFDYCEGRGLCVQGVRIRDGEWFGNVRDHLAHYGVSEIPRFNGGLIYYERTPECQAVIKSIYSEADKRTDSTIVFDGAWVADEPFISVAMAKADLDNNGGAHLIPDEMDFMNTATGLIGNLELDVARSRCSFLCNQFGVRVVQPSIFHASRYHNFTVYWKQLDKLASLDRYGETHVYGYMSTWQKLERSIQRRYLKYIKRVL